MSAEQQLAERNKQLAALVVHQDAENRAALMVIALLLAANRVLAGLLRTATGAGR